MKIKLNKITDLEDWFTIIRAEHDGRSWVETVGPDSYQYMCSERLSPEACIEGTAAEMIVIANVIKSRGAVMFKRCAASCLSNGVSFHSPRNSQKVVVVSYEDADELAYEILQSLGGQNVKT